jgi:peptide-methionine (S)-S-oxide reductase
MNQPFGKLDGSSRPPDAGGMRTNPTYEDVSAGGTGHTEVVQVLYDPKKIAYEKLLDVYWRNVDPTVKDRQFCDVGSQYRTSIFVHTDDQRRAAEASKAALEKSKPFKEAIITPIVAAPTGAEATRTTTGRTRSLHLLSDRLRPRRADEASAETVGATELNGRSPFCPPLGRQGHGNKRLSGGTAQRVTTLARH